MFGDDAAKIVSGDAGDDTIDMGLDPDAATGDNGAFQQLSDLALQGSGDGTDTCDGAAGIDTAVICESVTGVP